MSEDGVDPKKEEEWQAYLRRRRRGKRILMLGTIILVASSVLALLPGAVAAFSGTPYIVPTGWEQYLTLAFIFGLVLIFAGFISMISPNMMEGDALWVMKMGPFPSRG